MIKNPKIAIRRFIIGVGIISLINSIVSIGSYDVLPVTALGILIFSILLSLFILLIGIKFNSWVVLRPKMLVRFFWFYSIWTVINTLYAYSLKSVGFGALLFTVIYVLVIIYIIRKIKLFSNQGSELSV